MFYRVLCLAVVLCGFSSEGSNFDDLDWLQLATKFPEIHLAIDDFNDFALLRRQSGEYSQLHHGGPLKMLNDSISVWKTEILDLFHSPANGFSPKLKKCNEDIVYTLFNLILREMWAIKMLDATGKPPSGFLRGGATWLGNSKECEDVQAPEERTTNYQFGGFRGHQCLVQISVPWNGKEMTLRIGVCFPTSCSSEHLKSNSDAFTQLIGYIAFPNSTNATNSTVQITDIDCSDHRRSWTKGDIAYMAILSIFCALVIVGTLWDIWNRIQKKILYSFFINKDEGGDRNQHDNLAYSVNEEERLPENAVVEKEHDSLPVQSEKKSDFSKSEAGLIEEFFICFSLYTNTERLINVGEQKGQLSCLHGVRFLSMTWVILGHTFLSCLTSVGNPLDVIHILLTSFSALAITQGTYSVDTFFFLSGFLLAYLFLKEYGKTDKSVNWIYYYLHRLWRLSPAFFMVLGFYTTIWLHLGYGPLWPTKTEDGRCEKYWWWDVLYILNFQKSAKMCMAWAWYLANDMQFYIISPLFLIGLWKSPIVGYISVGVVMLASWITTGIISSNNNMLYSYGPTNSSDADEQSVIQNNGLQNLFDDIYVKPYCRIGPYLVGILVGYALYKTRGNRKIMKVWMAVLGWLIALFLMSIVIFGVYHSNMGLATTAAYNALSRTAWSIGVGWVVYSCLTGFGGPFNALLSWKLWVPLSRLTYCAYLVHPLILGWYFSSLQSILFFEMKTMVIYYFGFLLASYVAAFATTLVFESPMMAVEKVMLKHFSRKRQQYTVC